VVETISGNEAWKQYLPKVQESARMVRNSRAPKASTEPAVADAPAKPKRAKPRSNASAISTFGSGSSSKRSSSCPAIRRRSPATYPSPQFESLLNDYRTANKDVATTGATLSNLRRERLALYEGETGSLSAKMKAIKKATGGQYRQDVENTETPVNATVPQGVNIIATLRTPKRENTNMNTRIKALLAVLSVAVFTATANAAPVPWIQQMTYGGSISVPAGKILIIQNIGPSATGIIRATITGTATGGIGSGPFSAPFVWASTGAGGFQFTSPLRLGPGMTLTHVSGPTFTIYGIAMDTTDFQVP
jgi:hypothetical protein